MSGHQLILDAGLLAGLPAEVANYIQVLECMLEVAAEAMDRARRPGDPDVILPDWETELPPSLREHIEGLEATVLDLTRRLERSRQRSRSNRRHYVRARALEAENQRLRGELARLRAEVAG